ncbi:C-C motif chemokine 27a [Corythoichthys intestinalis]|uniref:C-C motif chemokine 27a n=1 Tax=Corythoichthys intestinalis TaxID=161448 RepID=UPI0025A66109|nr:C-C motif chemokine 27a [Corythoichthys intestinalis]
MDLKVVVLTLCLVALAIDSTEGGISKCCMNTRKTVPKLVLRKVQTWYMQDSSGPCDIDALVLYVVVWKKPICVHPNMEKDLKRVLKMKKMRLGKTH